MAEYHVENFGCRASHADGNAIAAALAGKGLHAASGPYTADIVVLNTCSVTAEAERTARSFLRRVQRTNPGARVLVTGCYAQRAPDEAATLPGVDAVVGNSHKGLVGPIAVQLLDPEGFRPAAFVPLAAVHSSAGVPVFADDFFAHAELSTGHVGATGASSVATRPNLKVQDGCGNRCSFCIIPTTRGASRSMPLAQVLGAVHRFVEAGGSELVLSGINLGRWGRDLTPAAQLEDLVAAILQQTTLPRLRLSSVEPMDWTPALLSLYREYGQMGIANDGPRLARHAHLPLQSGADAILRAMHRRYRPWHYAEKLAAIRAAMPQAAIGADVMAGFPGETDALFEDSFRFVERQPFTYLHLFPFSARPGTPGWALQQQRPVAAPAVKERMARLSSLAAEKNRAFRASFTGQMLPIITLHTSEAQRARGVTAAISDNFIKIELSGAFTWNQRLSAHITSLSREGLVATPTPRQ